MAENQRLEEDEIKAYLMNIPEWSRDGKFIQRRYRFATFKQAVGFVNQVAEVAERNNHHPFISIDYKVVTLRLTSWHAGGLTALDFKSATEFEGLLLHLVPLGNPIVKPHDT